VHRHRDRRRLHRLTLTPASSPARATSSASVSAPIAVPVTRISERLGVDGDAASSVRGCRGRICLVFRRPTCGRVSVRRRARPKPCCCPDVVVRSRNPEHPGGAGSVEAPPICQGWMLLSQTRHGSTCSPYLEVSASRAATLATVAGTS
jgi:hypothetical protein